VESKAPPQKNGPGQARIAFYWVLAQIPCTQAEALRKIARVVEGDVGIVERIGKPKKSYSRRCAHAKDEE
jgi:hypothetical protein